MKPIDQLVAGDEVRQSITFTGDAILMDQRRSYATDLLNDWQNDLGAQLVPGLMFEATDEDLPGSTPDALIGISRVARVVAVP